MRPDLDDVPETVRAALTLHLVDDVTEVIELALAAQPPRCSATSSGSRSTLDRFRAVEISVM